MSDANHIVDLSGLCREYARLTGKTPAVIVNVVEKSFERQTDEG